MCFFIKTITIFFKTLSVVLQYLLKCTCNFKDLSIQGYLTAKSVPLILHLLTNVLSLKIKIDVM